MKKPFFLLAFAAIVLSVEAQSLAKKYVLIEHFTNTKCPVCANKNPAFYNLIQQYPNDVRHLAIHPSFPYNSCLIYLANPAENSKRTSVYPITGTPQVAVNGTLIPAGSALLPAPTLQNALGQTSPISIQVQEGGAFPTKTAQVTVRTHGAAPAGAYKIYAAVAEKTVNYTSPNTEQKHYDVFRAMLPNIYGQNITLPPVGGTVSFNYTYNFTAPSGWTSNFDSLYILAFVQDTMTREVLNTGTRFDPVALGAGEAAVPQAVRIQPNPATDAAAVFLPGEQVERVEVYSFSGNRVYTGNETQSEWIDIPVAALLPGIYLVRLTGRNGIYVGKMLKE